MPMAAKAMWNASDMPIKARAEVTVSNTRSLPDKAPKAAISLDHAYIWCQPRPGEQAGLTDLPINGTHSLAFLLDA